MTPEELNELRKSAAIVTQIGIHNAEIYKHPYNGVNNASFALVNLPGLLAHIDQQAKQIEALKEKLVEERARRICHLPREDEVGHWPRYEDIVVKEARKQLAEELSEVDWE